MSARARIVISSCQLGSQGLSRASQFVFFEFQYSSIVIKIVLDICNVSIKLSFTKMLVLFIVSKIIISGNKLRYRKFIWLTCHHSFSRGKICCRRISTHLKKIGSMQVTPREMIDWFEFNYTLVVTVTRNDLLIWVQLQLFVAVTRNDWLIWVQLHAWRSCYEKWLTDLSSVTRLL